MTKLIFNTGPYNAAAEVFGADLNPQIRMPRQRFQFRLEIKINDDVNILGLDQFGGRLHTFHRVQSVSMPDIQHNVTVLNQYNRKRYLPTSLDVSPFSVVFYDTKDSHWQNIYQAYSAHYFHGHNVAESAILNYDALSSNPALVYGSNTVTTSAKYFFDYIRIVTIDTVDQAKILTAYNCVISDVNTDTLVYSDSNPVMWTVRFQPEQVNIETVNGDARETSNSSSINSNNDNTYTTGASYTSTQVTTPTASRNVRRNIVGTVATVAAADLVLNRGRGVTSLLNRFKSFF